MIPYLLVLIVGILAFFVMRKAKKIGYIVFIVFGIMLLIALFSSNQSIVNFP